MNDEQKEQIVAMTAPPTKEPRHMNQMGYKEIYRLRALEMVDRKIHGKNIEEISLEFNCHPDTTRRAIQWAVREGAVEKIEQSIINDLGHMAVDVYKKQLQEGNEFVAKDVLANIVKLGDRFAQRESQQEEQSLRAYIEERRDERNTKPPKPATLRTYPQSSADAGGTSEPLSTDPPIIDITAITEERVSENAE